MKAVTWVAPGARVVERVVLFAASLTADANHGSTSVWMPSSLTNLTNLTSRRMIKRGTSRGGGKKGTVWQPSPPVVRWSGLSEVTARPQRLGRGVPLVGSSSQAIPAP